MVAPVFVVFDIVRILKFVRRDVLVAQAGFFRKRLRIPLMRFGNRRRVSSDGYRVMPQHAMRSPRQIGGIGASRICNDDAAKSLENAKQLLFLLIECLRVKFRRFHLERDQRCHISEV